MRTSPIIDGHLINVNVTSSSPPDTETHQPEPPNKLLITRANSAKNPYSVKSSQRSRKSSTITFQEPIIKRPNSTIGIPTSGIPNSQSLYTNFTDKAYIYYNGSPYLVEHSANSSNGQIFVPNPTVTTIETPESDILSSGFSPVVREKASSLTLTDSKLQFLRKGSSNPFLTTNSDGLFVCLFFTLKHVIDLQCKHNLQFLFTRLT